jgi:predicted ATP-dependent endonuclease of OLD family
MKIIKVEIENFRSIKHLVFEPSQVCALVGPNNAGKTNVLLAIQYVLGKDWLRAKDFSEDDVYGRDPGSDIRIAITFDPPIQYSKFKSSAPVDIVTLSFEFTRYKIGTEAGQRRLEQKCLDANGKQVLVPTKAPKTGEKLTFAPVLGIPNEVREQIPVILIDTNRRLEDHLPSARYSLLKQLLEDINSDFQDPSKTIDVTAEDGSVVSIARSDRFSQLMADAQKLLRTADFEALEQSIKKNALEQLGYDPMLDGDKLDLFFSPLSAMDFYKLLDLKVNEGNFAIKATELGGGIQNALVLAILRAYEERRKKGAIILLEEPEIALHPHMQRSLYKTIRKIGETNQVIYTTHSPHFVTIPSFEEVRIIRKTGDGTFMTNSNLPIDAARREKIRKELDPERNELFFAKRVLFVEGDTEKMAIPEYAKRLGIDLDRAGATIVEVGGKRNLLEFAQIASSLEMPIGVLYDKDSSDFKNDPSGEALFNASLDQLASGTEDRKVWKLSNNYEDELKTLFGDQKYQELCNKFGPVSKAVRARLIAEQETNLAIPSFIQEIVEWLFK